jgi:hypothetical protein
MARPRKTNVKRDTTGRSRGESGIHPETLAVRERHLRAAGVPLTFEKRELTRNGWQGVLKRTAEDRLAGFTLGVLRLRPKDDPGSISEAQFDAGDEFCQIVHRHAAIMGYKLTVPSPNFMMMSGGRAVTEPDEETIARVRGKFRLCFDALMEETRVHGKRVWQVTYGVCVENWPPASLSMADYGYLRTGLNALGKSV